MNHTERLKNIWQSVYANGSEVVSVIEIFFDPDYEQCINGITMHRPEYINHVIAQKQNMIIESIDYKNIIEKEDELFAIYYPKKRNLAGLAIKAEVIAYFKFRNKRIFRIHGQVRLIDGDLSDVDMN